MSNTNRIDKDLFREQHYLGKPADDEDKIISRRITVLERYPEFFDKSLTCIEAGCGGGATITRIANRFKNALGIDIYDYSKQFEEQKQKNSALNCNFKQVDLEKEKLKEQFEQFRKQFE